MTPAMTTALSARQVLLTGLIRINLPGHTIRLCDGPAALEWNGETYTGRDATFGVLGEVEAISEASGDTVPALDIQMLPPSLAGAVQLCHPSNQGAPVRVWLVAVDAESGTIIPDPELLFAGEIDTATLNQDREAFSVELAIASVFERLFEPDEGVRLADAYHQGLFLGELGLANMTGTPIEDLWGPGDKPPGVTVVPQGGGGGADRGRVLGVRFR